jgi:hypothetical protein
MGVCHAERSEASRILTGLETLGWAHGDHAHGVSGSGTRPFVALRVTRVTAKADLVRDRIHSRSQANRLRTHTSRRPQFASPLRYVIIDKMCVYVTTIPKRWA